jgi:hypothetical protein
MNPWDLSNDSRCRLANAQINSRAQHPLYSKPRCLHHFHVITSHVYAAISACDVTWLPSGEEGLRLKNRLKFQRIIGARLQRRIWCRVKFAHGRNSPTAVGLAAFNSLGVFITNCVLPYSSICTFKGSSAERRSEALRWIPVWSNTLPKKLRYPVECGCDAWYWDSHAHSLQYRMFIYNPVNYIVA